MYEDVVNDSVTGFSADAMAEWGLTGLSLTRAMSDFYVLERLTADGSPRARRMLAEHERKLAPMLLRYVSMACGGELRHLPRQSQDPDDYCYDEMLECGCYYYDHEHNTRNNDYCPEDCDVECCGEEGCLGDCHECIPVQWWCDWPDGDWSKPGPMSCDCWRCTENYDDEWRHSVSEEIAEWVMDGLHEEESRNGSWHRWIKFSNELGIATALAHMVPAFEPDLWPGGGFGGKAWQTAAKVARDYASRKLSARLFIDRCWTLQHNGGMLFDKVWKHMHCTDLMKLLQEQAEDNYAPLAHAASPDVRALWRVREYHISGRAERAAEWLGVQPTHDTEVEW